MYRRLLPPLAALPLLAASWAALAASATSDLDDRAERSRIAAERSAAESRYAAEEAECRKRFVVTTCVDEAKARRRETLGRLKHQELVLDEQDRRRRAAARLQAIEEKQREAAARPPMPAQPAPVIREAASAPAARAPQTPSAAERAQRARDEAARAQRRAQAAEDLRQQAAEDRARISEREADRRAKDKKPSTPLPARPEIPKN
ncbi:preprotein translocase subunit SecD [Rubrivivax gelatinosus]|uniref:hypothetical protein n=1 Tax=Rubrivivax gelatinosus TaxID=28068 RepID=UPI0018CA9E50|nr:hypothetical protein [Rubrivivax gelatinosus]MBG6082637.1 preprotein translocase subunit SecD [Rubrivivax gelatinosus]